MRRSGWAGRIRGAAVAAGVGAAFLTATSVAQADWTAPQKVSAIGPETSDAQVAVDAAGDITVVWKNGFAEGSIGSAFRSAGGDWQPPVTPISTTTCHDPKLAVNSSGAAVVVADCGTGTTKMKAAYRSTAGGSWGTAAVIPGSESGKEPRVGIDDAGNATVVWARETDGTVQSSYKAAAGAWAETSKQVSTAGETSVPQIAVSPSGIETAIWLHKVSASITAVESKDRTGGGEWGAVETLTKVLPNPVAISEPQVEWNANGQRLAAWALTGSPVNILQSHWGAVGSWSEEISIKSVSDGARDVEEPRIAIDGQGRAVAIWRSAASGTYYPQASFTSSLAGSWSPPVLLSNVTMGGFIGAEPQLAIDPAGNATAVWAVIGGAIYSAARPAGGGFGAAAQIPGASSTIADPPQVAMDPGGDAFVVWVANETSFVLDDNTPPALSAISVPVGGKAGVAAAMSATGTDSWSSPVTINWDFGDGTTASGAAVSHAYASAGTKTVTVSATDAAGNTSAGQTRQIVVTGSPPPPPPPLKLSVEIPKQSWKAIAKARGVKLKCGLDVVGSCRANASLTGPIAKRLGLSSGKRVKVGAGSVQLPHADRRVVLVVKLNGKVRAAIAAASRSVPLQLEVTGSAPGHVSAAKTRTLTIKRP